MKRSRRQCLHLAAGAAALPAISGIAWPAPNQIISFDGVGAVRIGMTVAAVEHALDARLDPLNTLVFSQVCWVTQRSDGVDPGLQYTFEGQQLARIDVWRPGGVAAPSASSADGIGIDASEIDVRRVYGSAVTETADPYSDQGSWLQVADPDRGRGMIFEVESGKVTAIRTGLTAVINAAEVCQ
jgi:hypothetical protein